MEIMHREEVTKQSLSLDLTPKKEFVQKTTEPSFPDTLGSCALCLALQIHTKGWSAPSLAVWPPPRKVFTVPQLGIQCPSQTGPTPFPASPSPQPIPTIPSSSFVLSL